MFSAASIFVTPLRLSRELRLAPPAFELQAWLGAVELLDAPD